MLISFSRFCLSYSTNIRVDLLGYWFCFFSLLFLLENRFLIAGFLLGIGFITTQKAIWYIFASDVALGIYWLVTISHVSKNTLSIHNIIQFNLVIASVIIAYLIFWSAIASWNTVIDSVFYEARVMYSLSWYNDARALFWSGIILYNPLLFLLWPLTCMSVLVTYDHDHSYYQRLLVVIYALIILMCLISYKQVFPYYMQVAIPTVLVLYAAFFTWLIAIFKPDTTLKLLVNKYILWLFLVAYIGMVIFIASWFDLPRAYLLICLIPMLIGTHVTRSGHLGHELVTLFFNLIILSMIFIGGIYSLSVFSIKLFKISGAYQKANIEAVNALLQDNSDYVAGIELIYNKTQPIAGMRHLMGPAVDYLYSPSKILRPVMLASLYQDPNVTQKSVIQSLKKSDVKFYVNNYRMNALPHSIKRYLNSQYEHFWGSIYLYAPYITAGEKEIFIKFPGSYQIEAKGDDPILLNGKKYTKNSNVTLQKGKYRSNAKAAYRLKLIPNHSSFTFNPKFLQDEWSKLLG